MTAMLTGAVHVTVGELMLRVAQHCWSAGAKLSPDPGLTTSRASVWRAGDCVSAAAACSPRIWNTSKG